MALEWSAPHECPDRPEVLAALRQHWPEGGQTSRLRARARVVRDGAGFHLKLDLEGDAGRARRTLSDPDCAALAEAAAVLIALALENRDTTGTQEPAEDASLPPSPDDAASSEFHLQLTASGRADFGTFPQQPALGIQAQLAARIDRLYVALGATYWTPRTASSASYPSAQLSGSGLISDLSIGVDATARPVVLTPQLNLEVGRLEAEAFGIAGPEQSSTLWIAFGPAASLAVSVLDDWSIALELAGLVTAYRAHWLVRTPSGDVPAFVSSSLVLRLAVRIGYALR